VQPSCSFAIYASSVPYFDDWDIVGYLTGDFPVTWEWLWSQQNEHRLPLRRAVTLALVKLGGGDLRVVSYFNVLASAALAFGLASLNAQEGRQRARELRSGMANFEKDMHAGIPAYELVRRHKSAISPGENDEGVLAELMTMMHRKSMGPFRDLIESPPFTEIPMPVAPTASHEIKWTGPIAHGTGSDSCLEYTLPEARFVAGVRLQCEHSNSGVGASLEVDWSNGDKFEYAKSAQSARFYIGQEEPVTVYIAAKVKHICIRPDFKPFDFRLRELTLLIPDCLYRPGTRLELGQNVLRAYLAGDWHDQEDWGRWSGCKPAFKFHLETVQPLRLRMLGGAFGKQRMTVCLNGHDIAQLDVGREPHVIEVDLPGAILTEANTIELILPDAASPQKTAGREDDRVLGIGIAWIELVPSPDMNG
jgi:hypothetical protein